MDDIPDLETIRVNLRRLRRQAEWYRFRLQDVCDKIALLEGEATSHQRAAEEIDRYSKH